MGSKVEIDDEAVGLLVRLLTESNLTEIEYKQHDTHIRVTKAPPPVISQNLPAFSSLSETIPQTSSPQQTTDTPVEKGMAITSPLVGTVYLAPDPSSPPFVTPGASVQEGQTLLIVEAMKVMNPVRAPSTGTIKEICIENAAPVEFGETLLYLVA